MTITRIRVPSQWFNDTVGMARGTMHRTGEFVLGVGPCGKTVERLDILYHVWGVEIVQVCTCTEQKNFVYPWATVTGRVEVTHG
jgi:hypothetical protein